MGFLTNLLSRREEEQPDAAQTARERAVDDGLAPGSEDDFMTPDTEKTDRWVQMLRQIYGGKR